MYLHIIIMLSVISAMVACLLSVGELEDSDHESCENIKIEDQPPSGSEDATIKRPVSSTSSAKSTKSGNCAF